MADDQQFYVGQKALINRNDEILILHDSIIGDDLPGGKVQVGETDFVGALEREVKEETGLQVRVGNPFHVGFFEFPKTSAHRNAGKKIYLVMFACTYLSGEVALSEEHDRFFWVNKNNFMQFIAKPWEQNILAKYFVLFGKPRRSAGHKYRQLP